MNRSVTLRRCYPVLITLLALAIGGCASAHGQGRTALRQGRYAEAASNFGKALEEQPGADGRGCGIGDRTV